MLELADNDIKIAIITIPVMEWISHEAKRYGIGNIVDGIVKVLYGGKW